MLCTLKTTSDALRLHLPQKSDIFGTPHLGTRNYHDTLELSFLFTIRFQINQVLNQYTSIPLVWHAQHTFSIIFTNSLYNIQSRPRGLQISR